MKDKNKVIKIASVAIMSILLLALVIFFLVNRQTNKELFVKNFEKYEKQIVKNKGEMLFENTEGKVFSSQGDITITKTDLTTDEDIAQDLTKLLTNTNFQYDLKVKDEDINLDTSVKLDKSEDTKVDIVLNSETIGFMFPQIKEKYLTTKIDGTKYADILTKEDIEQVKQKIVNTILENLNEDNFTKIKNGKEVTLSATVKEKQAIEIAKKILDVIKEDNNLNEKLQKDKEVYDGYTKAFDEIEEYVDSQLEKTKESNYEDTEEFVFIQRLTGNTVTCFEFKVNDIKENINIFDASLNIAKNQYGFGRTLNVKSNGIEDADYIEFTISDTLSKQDQGYKNEGNIYVCLDTTKLWADYTVLTDYLDTYDFKQIDDENSISLEQENLTSAQSQELVDIFGKLGNRCMEALEENDINATDIKEKITGLTYLLALATN